MEETQEYQDTYIRYGGMALFLFTTQSVGRVIKHAKQVTDGLQPRTALTVPPIQTTPTPCLFLRCQTWRGSSCHA